MMMEKTGDISVRTPEAGCGHGCRCRSKQAAEKQAMTEQELAKLADDHPASRAADAVAQAVKPKP